MGSKRSEGYAARRRERERQRRQAPPEKQSQDRRTPRTLEPSGAARRAAAEACAWCGGRITPGRRGPIPKWCSATCRHRAWEQARAATSGLSAVRIVERQVEVPIPATPTRRDWKGLLQELAHQLDDGRIYDRDLPQLTGALNSVLDAYRRRMDATSLRERRHHSYWWG